MLQDFIRASGQSQAHWAGAFGISAGFLSQLLRGTKAPSLDVAFRIERQTGGKVPAASWVAGGNSVEAAE